MVRFSYIKGGGFVRKLKGGGKIKRGSDPTSNYDIVKPCMLDTLILMWKNQLFFIKMV